MARARAVISRCFATAFGSFALIGSTTSRIICVFAAYLPNSKRFSKKWTRSMSPKKSKRDKSACKQFAVITNQQGESITQTLSGRIVKIHRNEQYYAKLDKLLDADGDADGEENSQSDTTNDDDGDEGQSRPQSPPTKKRKLSKTTSKYQYPFLLKSCMPEPGDENDDEFRVETRNAYIKTTKKDKTKKYEYPYHSGGKKHINRGFACIIQQIERKRRRQISTFWKKERFERQIKSNVYDGRSAEDIPLLFADYLKSARVVEYAIVDSDDVYHFESPLQLKLLSRYGPFKALKHNERMLGIQMPVESLLSSPFSTHFTSLIVVSSMFILDTSTHSFRFIGRI